jgi:transcriptional regulator with XRE-family HTH domain
MKTSEWIKTGRKRIGYSRERFAEVLDCSTTSIKSWEAGARSPSVRYMELLISQLGMPRDLEYRGGRIRLRSIPGTDRKLVLFEQE